MTCNSSRHKALLAGSLYWCWYWYWYSTWYVYTAPLLSTSTQHFYVVVYCLSCYLVVLRARLATACCPTLNLLVASCLLPDALAYRLSPHAYCLLLDLSTCQTVFLRIDFYPTIPPNTHTLFDYPTGSVFQISTSSPISTRCASPTAAGLVRVWRFWR